MSLGHGAVAFGHGAEVRPFGHGAEVRPFGHGAEVRFGPERQKAFIFESFPSLDEFWLRRESSGAAVCTVDAQGVKGPRAFRACELEATGVWVETPAEATESLRLTPSLWRTFLGRDGWEEEMENVTGVPIQLDPSRARVEVGPGERLRVLRALLRVHEACEESGRLQAAASQAQAATGAAAASQPPGARLVAAASQAEAATGAAAAGVASQAEAATGVAAASQPPGARLAAAASQAEAATGAAAAGDAAGDAAAAGGAAEAAAAQIAKDATANSTVERAGGQWTVEEWAANQAEFAHLPPQPPGWIRIRASDTGQEPGKIYFQHLHRNVATWEMPEADLPDVPLPGGWHEVTSKTTGKTYYWHSASGKSQFEPPEP